MVVAYVVFSVIGIILGIFVFFLGLALFGIYMKAAKEDIEKENKIDISSEDSIEKVEAEAHVENSSSEVVASVTQGNIETEVPERREVTEMDIEGIKRREKLFSPLPTWLAIEGAILFIFHVVMLILKFKLKAFVDFYVLIAVDVGFAGLATLINSVVLSPKSQEKSAENPENTIDKPE